MDDKFNIIINDIYMAAADPLAWSQALEKISELFGNSKIGLNHQNFAQEDLSWCLMHDYDIESVRLHYEVFNTPEKNVGLKALLAAKPLEPFTVSSFLTPEEYYSNDSINISLISQDIHYGLFNVVDKECANTSLLLYRGKDGGDYTARDAEMMKALGVHVRNAVRLAHSNILMSLRQETQRQIAGEHRWGTILVGRNGAIVDADAFAQTVIEHGDGVSMRNGRLQIASSCTATGLDPVTFLESAPELTSFFVQEGPQSFLILKKLPTPYLHTALYLPTTNVALAIRRVEFKSTNIATPAQAFGLTPGECAVAELACLGHSQDEIGDQLQISRNTVKTHLRSIFDKTETRRQSELVAKLLKLTD